jgi:hypothetical protein
VTEPETIDTISLIESVAPPVPAIDIFTSSLRFLKWAHDNGLLVPSAYYPGDGYEPPLFDTISPDAIILLRQKQIRFVGINESRAQITVFLNKVAPGARLSKVLPLSCDGYQLMFRQGNTNEVSPINVAEAANPCAMHVLNGTSYYTCGSSISVGNDRAAGTLSCLLMDAAGDLYGMSNNHVSGACNYAPAGLPIIAPGVLDVSPQNPPPFTIGFHSRQLQMQLGDPSVVDTVLNQDVAVFKIAQANLVSSMQQNEYDTPISAMALVPGMQVEKVGRTSGFTRGRVTTTVTGPLGVSYSASQYNFSGFAYFETMTVVHGLTDRFSDSGDSGSLVVHTDGNGIRHAVGIVVAGGEDSSAPGGKMSLIMPIQPILTRLGMSLVSGHNV